MKARAAYLLCALAAALAPVGASAQPGGDSLGAGWRQQQEEARKGVQRGQFLPLGQIIDAIRRRTPGRQLDAGLEAGPGGRQVYRVRWAAMDGRRIDYLVDAETGAIVRADGE
jgi:uncharacterized membrane protein YkoI